MTDVIVEYALECRFLGFYVVIFIILPGEYLNNNEYRFKLIKSTSINQYQPVSTSINQYQPISTDINQYQLINLFKINQYQPAEYPFLVDFNR